MKYSNQSYNIRIDLDTQNCELSAAEITQVEESLSPLRELVKDFPVADLYVNIEYKLRSHEYRLKVALQLPGNRPVRQAVEREDGRGNGERELCPERAGSRAAERRSNVRTDFNSPMNDIASDRNASRIS